VVSRDAARTTPPSDRSTCCCDTALGFKSLSLRQLERHREVPFSHCRTFPRFAVVDPPRRWPQLTLLTGHDPETVRGAAAARLWGSNPSPSANWKGTERCLSRIAGHVPGSRSSFPREPAPTYNESGGTGALASHHEGGAPVPRTTTEG
jgi:hypothetical protein